MNDFDSALERYMNEERSENRGPPEGNADRRVRDGHGGPHMREEPTLADAVDVAEQVAKPWMKVAGALVAVVTFLVGAGIVINPYMTRAQVNEAFAARDVKIDQNRTDINTLKVEVSDIKTNTAKGLRSQLRRDIRDISGQIGSLPMGSPARKRMEDSLVDAQGDLDDVQAQLGDRR